MDLFQSDRKRQRISLEEGMYKKVKFSSSYNSNIFRRGERSERPDGQQQLHPVPGDRGRGGGGRGHGHRGLQTSGGHLERGQHRCQSWGNKHNSSQQRPGRPGPVNCEAECKA